jgi:two-component system CheB/CheR fusion protein
VVVVDYNLPGGLSGIEVISRLRTALGYDLPALVLTGDISTETLKDIARHECDQRSKPIKPEELTRLVQTLLADKRSARLQASAPRAVTTKTNGHTIFVVDDDSAVRGALREFIEQHGRQVEVYGSARDFLDAFRSGRKGCLVVDCRLPDMNGMELFERLKAEGHELPTIMITGYGDVPLAVRAMKAGAASFIEKPVRGDDLLAAIDGALEQTRHEAEFSVLRDAKATRIAALTPRQRRVMDLVVEGKPNKEIAAILGINQRTIEGHRAAVMKKTGATSLAQLVRLTIEAGAPSPPRT